MAAPSQWPESLKAIKPYLQRARELETQQPLVSYYCNLYALQRGIRERDATDEAAADFIKGLLTRCEGLRGNFGANTDDHRWQVEEFAIGVFESAESIYLAGQATEATAQHFFAAMCFFDVCTHFAPLSEELARSRGKARLFAGLIRRDVRAGKPPLPPELATSAHQSEEAELERELNRTDTPPAPVVDKYHPPIPPAPQVEEYGAAAADNRDDNPLVSSTTASTMYGGLGGFFNSAGSITPPPPPPPPPPADSPPADSPPADSPPAAAPWQPTAPAPPTPTPPPAAAAAPSSAPASAAAAARPRAAVPGFQPSNEAKSQAQRKAKFSISALDFNDVPTAISNLTQALELLTGGAP